MSLEDAWKIAWSAIVSLGGGSLIVLGCANWLGRLWAERLNAKTQSEHAERLERLRVDYQADLSHLQAKLAQVASEHQQLLAVQRQSFELSHPEVLVALKGLWTATLAVRAAFSGVFFYHQLMEPDAVKRMPVEAAARAMAATSRAEFEARAAPVMSAGDELRPFVGEALFHRFFAYRAFMGRLAFTAVQEYQQGRFFPWQMNAKGERDLHLERLMHSVLTEAEVQSAEPTQAGAPNRIGDLMLTKMLEEMNHWIFGRRFVEMSLEQRIRIRDASQPDP